MSTSSYAPIDPVVLELLWTRLISAVDEAAKVIVRTSFSTLSNEANDFACVLTDAEGRALAQNTSAIPSFIGCLPATVRHFIERLGKAAIRPGDILVTNNPWEATGHLNDITLVKPIFHGGRLVAFAASTSHVPDIGGRVRSTEPRELYEEGFHIPLMHLVRQGRTDETLIKLLRTNVRTPDQTVGDVWAQATALELMEKRVLAAMGDYGLVDLHAFATELFRRSAAAMEAAIRKLPEGTVQFQMQTDGIEAPYTFQLALTVKDGRIIADYTGTSPQQPRAINCVWIYTFAMTAYAIKCALLPEIPNNEGMYRALTIVAPDGSLLNPRAPASVGGRAAVGHYVPALVFGALHQMIPGRVTAAPGSPLWILTLSGIRDDGRPFATVLFYNGGMGARADGDGLACIPWPSNISSTPVEIAERNGELRFHWKRLRPDSGGAGETRGGLGQEIMIESRSKREVQALLITERTRIAAHGLGGGDAGALGRVELNGVPIDSRNRILLREGDRLLLATPGGGGFGPVAARDPARIERDLRLGYVAP